MPNGNQQQPWEVPFVGTQPEQVKGFPMTPEIMFRNVKDAFPGHKQELIETQRLSENFATVQTNWARKLEELEKKKQSYGMPLGGLSQLIAGDQDIDKQIQSVKETLASWEERQTTEFWKVQVLTTVPAMFDVGMVRTADDLLNYVQTVESNDGAKIEHPILPESMRTPETRAFAERVITQLQEQSDIRKLQVQGLTETREARMVNIDDLTVGEILKAFSSVPGPRLPEDLQPVELREVLADLGYDTTDLDAAMKDVRGELQEQLTAWAEIMNSADARIAAQRGVVNLSLGERALQAFTQPMLAMGSMFEEYSKRVSRPWAYIGIRGLTWLEAKLGSDVAARQMYDLEAAYKKAKADGFDSFGAYSYAYENWDTNWFYKMAGEIIFDPLTYVDLGLGFGIMNKLPKVGRLGRALGAFERSYNNFCDTPIRAISAISKKFLGRSIPGKAALRARQAGIYAIGAAREFSGVALNSEVTAKHILGAGLEAFARHLDNPTRLVDDIDKFGAELWNMTRKAFTKADLDDLVVRLDGSVELTDDTLFDVTVLLDRTENLVSFPRPVLAKELADILGSTNYDEALKFLDELVLEQTDRVGKLLSGANIKALVSDVYEASYADYLSRYMAEKSAVVIRSTREGMMHAMMKNTFQHPVASKIVTGYNFWIDRMIVLPMARHVLLFSGYAPMNLVESCIRVSVMGYAPWRGWTKEVFSHRDLTASILRGVDNAFVPQDIAQGEFAETFMEVSLRAAPKTGPETPTEVIARNIPGMTRPLPFAERLGFERGTMQNLNDWAGKVASEHRAFTYREMYKRGLGRVAPDQVESIATAVGKLSRHEFDRLSTKEIDGLQTLIEYTALVSPDAVRAIAPNRELLSSRKLLSDATEKLDELDLLDEFTKRAVIDLIRTGDMTSANVTDIIEEVIGATMDNHIAKMARATTQLRKLSTDFTTWTPKDKDEFLRMVDQLRELENEVIPRAIEDANAAVTVRGRQILSDKERTGLHKNAQKLMRDFLTESETTVKDMHKRLKQFESMLDPEQIEALNVRVNAWERRIRQLRTTRDKAFKVLGDYAELPPRTKTTMGWKTAYAETEAIWKSFWRQDGVDLAANEMFMRNLVLPQDVPKIKHMVPEMQAGLTVDHVSTIFGVTPDQVTYNLVNPESATMMGRERFTNYIRGKAGAIAKETGIVTDIDDILKTADAIGFTEKACDDVYDGIIRRAGLDPADIPQMGPQVEQLRGFGLTYRQMYDNKMLPNDTVDNLSAHINEVADNLEQLDMYDRQYIVSGTEKVLDETPSKLRVEVPEGQTRGDQRRRYSIMEGNQRVGHVTIKTTEDGIPVVTEFFPTNVYAVGVGEIPGMGTDTAIGRWGEEIIHQGNRILGAHRYAGRIDPAYWTELRQALTKADFPAEHIDDVETWINNLVKQQQEIEGKAMVPMLKALWDDIGIGNVFEADDILLPGGQRVLRNLHKKGHLEHVPATVEGGAKRTFNRKLSYEETKGSPHLYAGMRLRILSRPDIMELAGTQRKWVDVPKYDVRYSPTPEWAAARNQGAEQATKEYHQTFTDYSDESQFGAFMKKIYPFWTYESQRFPWLAQAHLRRPTLGLNLSRYMNYTDGGYITLPGTDLQINPFRGTVFMGGMRRLWMKDFPEYYDAMPFASGSMDYLSRYGFYPGAHFAVPLALLGTKVNSKTEWGEILLPWARTALNFGAAMPSAPGTATQWFRDKMFPDRFRTYMVAQRVIQLGGAGMDIYAKQEQGISLTANEKKIWAKAERDIAWRGLLQEQTGMFRFRPEEREEAYAKAEERMAEIIGVDIKVLRDIRRAYPVTGKTVYDMFPLTSTQIDQVREMEEYSKWNAGLITPLLPSEWRAEDTQRIRYYEEVDKIRARADTEGFPGFAQAYNFETGEALSSDTPISHQWLDEALRTGKINGRTFDALSGEIFAQQGAAMEALSNLEEFKDVPKTNDERRIQRQERGRPSSTYHPETELRWLYYELQPVFDATTATYDWDTFYAMQHAIISAVPEHLREEFETSLSKNWTQSRKQRWADYQNFMQPYYNSKYLVLEQFSPEQIELIEEYRRAPESIRGRDIRDTAMFDGDTKLIAHYDAQLQLVHDNMRIFDPQLDGILRYWGKVQTSKTPEGEEEYINLLKIRR